MEWQWRASAAPLGSPSAPYKGFGLALVVDALAGVLTGAAFGRDVPNTNDTGNLLWALDPEAFLPREEFLARVDSLIDQVKAGERLPGVDELLVPGERGQRRYDELIARGVVPLSAATWKVVERATASLSMAPPRADVAD
jgi:LDH2 family malate/lactate/ureidoglycolate dehydrogenase